MIEFKLTDKSLIIYKDGKQHNIFRNADSVQRSLTLLDVIRYLFEKSDFEINRKYQIEWK